jgi:membrane protein DedA with SNARE-associated domain
VPRLTDRQQLALLIVPIVAITVASTVADAISPTLLDEEPLLLEALVPRNRVFVLVAPQVDFLPFFVIGMVRLMLTDPIFYTVGRRYGDRAIEWAEKRSGSPRTVRTAEQWFRRAAYPIVAIAPSNLICTLAGATGMPPVPFLITNFAGTVARMALIWWIGDVFSEPLLDVVDFIADYRWWFTGLTVLLVAWSVWQGRRSGTSPIETLEEAEAELEGPPEPETET